MLASFMRHPVPLEYDLVLTMTPDMTPFQSYAKEK